MTTGACDRQMPSVSRLAAPATSAGLRASSGRHDVNMAVDLGPCSLPLAITRHGAVWLRLASSGWRSTVAARTPLAQTHRSPPVHTGRPVAEAAVPSRQSGCASRAACRAARRASARADGGHSPAPGSTTSRPRGPLGAGRDAAVLSPSDHGGCPADSRGHENCATTHHQPHQRRSAFARRWRSRKSECRGYIVLAATSGSLLARVASLAPKSHAGRGPE